MKKRRLHPERIAARLYTASLTAAIPRPHTPRTVIANPLQRLRGRILPTQTPQSGQPPEKQCFPLWQRNPTVRRPVFLRSRHRTGVAHESPRHDKTIWSPTFRMFGPSETSGNEPNKKIDCRSERIAPAAPITLQNKIRLYAVRPEATPCDAS